jgi:hypothetical protein
MLPQQLTRLAISMWGSGAEPDEEPDLQHFRLGSLLQLVTLEVLNGMSEPQLMQRVACLPKLQHVLLSYHYGSLAQR